MFVNQVRSVCTTDLVAQSTTGTCVVDAECAAAKAIPFSYLYQDYVVLYVMRSFLCHILISVSATIPTATTSCSTVLPALEAMWGSEILISCIFALIL